VIAHEGEKENDGEARAKPQRGFPQAPDARDEERLGYAAGLRSAQVLPEYIKLRC
jgi:hypothetical protein